MDFRKYILYFLNAPKLNNNTGIPSKVKVVSKKFHKPSNYHSKPRKTHIKTSVYHIVYNAKISQKID